MNAFFATYKNTRWLAIVIMLLTATLAAKAQPDYSMKSGRNSATHPQAKPANLPSYVVILDSRATTADTEISDSTFNAIAGHAIFPVNGIRLNTGSRFVRQLIDSVIPFANDNNLALVGIDMRGGASPEGPYDNNIFLSRNRLEALRNYIGDRLVCESDCGFSTQTIAEDYGYLLWLLRKGGDSAAPLVASIIDRYTLENPREIKAHLQSYAAGAVWKRLLSDYYPHLRAARIVLFFKPVTQHVQQEQLPAIPDVRLSEAEADRPYFPKPVFHPVFIERPHMLSLSTNLLYDAFYMPGFGWAPMINIGAEFFPMNSPWTFRAAFISPYYHRWSKNEFFQIRDYHLEARRYFNPGSLHTGLYLGAYLNATKYGIGLSATKGWQGEGAGGAIKIGYVIPLGNGRWRLDFHAAAGAFFTDYDPYVYGNPVTGDIDGDYYYDYTGNAKDFHRRSHRFFWAGPTEVGVTISFDILYYRLRAKGASVLRQEPIIF